VLLTTACPIAVASPPSSIRSNGTVTIAGEIDLPRHVLEGWTAQQRQQAA
jgi:hypothetical protein